MGAIHARTRRDEEPLAGLVARMAAGDQAALAELYDATSPQVLGTCLRILRDRSAAEEAVLDAFLQAWRSASSYDRSRGSVVAWLVVMGRSRALDALRSRARDIAPQLVPAPDPPLLPDDHASRSRDAERIRRALDALPPEQRQAVSAAFYDGLSHSEIALALGEPLGTIKTRIRTGLQRLRQELGPLEAFA